MNINSELLKQAASFISKQAFVAASDPMMTGDPAAAGGDPAAGGAPPTDPAAGGAPPADPAAAGGGAPAGPDPMMAIQSMVQQAVQQAMASQGGGAGAGGAAGGGIKPKIDVNVELMQIKKLLARIADAMGVQIPAAEMVATPDDLNQMAQQQQQAGGGGAAAGAIPPIQPMKAAGESPWEQGTAFAYSEQQAVNNHASLSDKAAALLIRNRLK